MEPNNLEIEEKDNCIFNMKPLFYAASSLFFYILIYVIFSDILTKKAELLVKSTAIPRAKLQTFYAFGIAGIVLDIVVFSLTTKGLLISYKKYSAPFYFIITYGVISFILAVINFLVCFNMMK